MDVDGFKADYPLMEDVINSSSDKNPFEFTAMADPRTDCEP